MFKGGTILGLIGLALVGAMIGDLVHNPGGTAAVFNGTNSLLTSSYQAASGAFA